MTTYLHRAYRVHMSFSLRVRMQVGSLAITKPANMYIEIEIRLRIDIEGLIVFDESVEAQGFYFFQSIFCCLGREAFDYAVFMGDDAALSQASQ